MRNRSVSWLAPLAIGAAAMYLLDPDRGARRRALIRDKAIRASRRTREGAAAVGTDLKNRTTGALAEMRGLVASRAVDDRTIEARVRSRLGRVCSHPGAVAVFASDGEVTLSGPVIANEHDDVIRATRSVRGVNMVFDALDVHDDAAGVPALQGGRTRPDQRFVWRTS